MRPVVFSSLLLLFAAVLATRVHFAPRVASLHAPLRPSMGDARTETSQRAHVAFAASVPVSTMASRVGEDMGPAANVRDSSVDRANSRGADAALAAIAVAVGEKDAQRRMQLICSALAQWAATDIDAAGAWALAPTGMSRDMALAAVIRAGAAVDPIATTRFVGRLSVECPGEAVELGHDLILALAQSGNFSSAAAWAVAGEQTNVGWITDAYTRWAAAAPNAALASATAIVAPAVREAAVLAVTDSAGAHVRGRSRAGHDTVQ